MSNFSDDAIHPITGKLERATFLDDHFGKHRYGVLFADGSIHRGEVVERPKRKVSADAAEPPAAKP